MGCGMSEEVRSEEQERRCTGREHWNAGNRVKKEKVEEEERETDSCSFSWSLIKNQNTFLAFVSRALSYDLLGQKSKDRTWMWLQTSQVWILEALNGITRERRKKELCAYASSIVKTILLPSADVLKTLRIPWKFLCRTLVAGTTAWDLKSNQKLAWRWYIVFLSWVRILNCWVQNCECRR